MNAMLEQAFSEIGAGLEWDRGRGFEIDILSRQGAERYRIQEPWGNPLELEVTDVSPHLRHLVLDVTGTSSGRYLCGHDESHWFVAGLVRNRRSGTVRGAMESLKPIEVLREERRKGVKPACGLRRNAVFIRQGEWFFLPRPKMCVSPLAVERNGELVRDARKPHRVDELYSNRDQDETFVRGRVRHVDHETLHLDVWHRVVGNTETAPDRNPMVEPEQSIAWLD